VNSHFQNGLDFFHRLLRSDYSWSLAEEYPLVFCPATTETFFVDHLDEALFPAGYTLPLDPSKSGFQLILTENGELVAGLAVLFRTVEWNPGVSRKMAFIGSVVTDPSHRKKGLQKKLFRILQATAMSSEVDCLMLWSNQIDFYQKIGFELGGLQASWIPTTSSSSTNPSSLPWKLACESDFKEEWFQYSKMRKFVPQRTMNEMKSLFKIPQMFLVEEGSAFALIGKGADFEGVCHEWGGPAEDVVKCFRKIREVDTSIRFLSPGVVHSHDEMSVMRFLETSGYEMRLEYLGLFKVLHPEIKMMDLQPNRLRHPFFVWGLDSI
jgi:predicted N-acetyltransferase YhbS